MRQIASSSSHFSDSAASLARAHHPNTTPLDSRCSTHGAGDRNSHERTAVHEPRVFRRDALPRSDAMETDLSLNACQKHE